MFGERYDLSTVYGVFLMNFKEHGLDRRFRIDAGLTDLETKHIVNKRIRLIYLQFPFFNKELNECETMFDKWIYVLKNMDSWERMPEGLKGQVFDRLAHLAAVANLSEEDQIAYDKALDYLSVEQTVRADEQKRKERIFQKGIARGMKKGMEQGLAKGQTQAILKIALQMKHNGLPAETIAQYTGLSMEDIKNLN